MKSILKIALGVCLGIFLAFAGCVLIVGVASVNSPSSLTNPLAISPVITASEYAAIRDGMSYSEVCRIIGEDGQEMASHTMPAIPGVMEAVVTESFSWMNEDGSNANFMFQNDKMNMKAQFGLR